MAPFGRTTETGMSLYEFGMNVTIFQMYRRTIIIAGGQRPKTMDY